MRKLLILVSMLCMTANAWAVEEIMRSYKGVRSLGMGGVETTTGIYDESLFGNPAMQLEDPNWKLTILGLTAETNTNFLSDMSKVSAIRSAQGAAVIQKIADDNLAGRNEHYRIGALIPAFYSPNFFGGDTSFAFGLLVNNQTNLMLRSNSDIDIQTLLDVGPSFGVAHKFLDGALDVGMNLHVQYRVSGDPTYNAANFLAGQSIAVKNIAGQGIGIDADIGAFYKLPFDPPFFKRISVGGSLNNLAQSTYRVAGTTLISSLQGTGFGNDRTGSLGVRADMPDAWFMTDNLFAIEFQDIGTTRRLASFWKKLHMGGETHVLVKWFSVRGGVNEGYLTGGVGFDLPIVKINVATYGEELGSNTGQLEDRRIALNLSFDI